MDTRYHLDRKETCVALNSKDCHAYSGFRAKLKEKKKKKLWSSIQTFCPNYLGTVVPVFFLYNNDFLNDLKFVGRGSMFPALLV